MKKPLILALAAAATLAMPVAAQAAPGQNINQKEQQIKTQIQRGLNNGKISRSEGRTLLNRLNQIERLEQQYRRSGGTFTNRERLDIDRKLTNLKAQIRYEKADRNDRRNDRYDRDGRDDRGNWNRR